MLADITSGLADAGHEVTALTFDQPGGDSFYPLSGKVTRVDLGIGDTSRRATVMETLARVRALRRAIKKDQPDVVVAFMHSMFVPAAFGLFGTGIPVIASEHIVPQHYKTRRLEFLLLLVATFFVRRVTVLSESVKASYPLFIRHKMIVIANPVRPPAALAHPEGGNDARKIILNVGRLDPQKDQETLIRAFATLAADYSGWDIRIVGEGALRSRLEAIIAEYGLQERIVLPGTTPDIGEEYRQAHIFALPSRYESFGLATAEAMAHGLPTIGFADCPGTNELIADNENGLLVKGVDRVQALASGLEKLMTAPGLRVRLGNAGRQRVDAYHPYTILKEWESLIKAVV